ncbi:hypothetical protein D3C80_1958340 [compost metagenome]
MLWCSSAILAQHTKAKTVVHDDTELVLVLELNHFGQWSHIAIILIDTIDDNESSVFDWTTTVCVLGHHFSQQSLQIVEIIVLE